MLANINYYEVFNFLLNFPQILLYYGCEELYGIIIGFVNVHSPEGYKNIIGEVVVEHYYYNNFWFHLLRTAVASSTYFLSSPPSTDSATVFSVVCQNRFFWCGIFFLSYSFLAPTHPTNQLTNPFTLLLTSCENFAPPFINYIILSRDNFPSDSHKQVFHCLIGNNNAFY